MTKLNVTTCDECGQNIIVDGIDQTLNICTKCAGDVDFGDDPTIRVGIVPSNRLMATLYGLDQDLKHQVQEASHVDLRYWLVPAKEA
jgi:hypothetical protein